MTVNPPKDRRPLTAAEFWRLAESGFFENERVELIGGEIVTVSPQGGRHSFFTEYAKAALEDVFGPAFWVRVQFTLNLAPHSVVDPDIAVVAGSMDEHYARDPDWVPNTALLVVESSHTTLSQDRNRKASLYASVGIADYWILDVAGRRLEVRRDPRPDPAAEFGHGYAIVSVHAPGDAVAPLARPGSPVAVADLFPV